MAYYDEIAEGYEELYREEQKAKLELIKENLEIRKTDKLLDVGCGTGISSGFDCFCVGVDNSANLLKQNKKLKLLAAAEHLPFKDKSFDIVISVTAMHNFNDTEIALKEAGRVGRERFAFSVLKKSGKFNEIKANIHKLFKIRKVIMGGKDTIFLTG